MSTISLDELARNSAAVLDRVQAGEPMLVVREGKPVAELRPLPVAASSARPFGLCRGQFSVPDEFDSPLPQHVQRRFES